MCERRLSEVKSPVCNNAKAKFDTVIRSEKKNDNLWGYGSCSVSKEQTQSLNNIILVNKANNYR